MAGKSPIMNFISPHWFNDVTKSSILVSWYRMMQTTQINFMQSQIILDLGEVRVIFNYGKVSYLDASNVVEFGIDHLRSINWSEFKLKETNMGGWTLLITPYVRDGIQRSEEEIRNSVIVAEGTLSAFNSPNMVYEKIGENIIELSPFKNSASPPLYLTFSRPPNLQPTALQLLSQVAVRLQALPENLRNRVELSLIWYRKSLVQGLDGFISIWIALEVIGMPNTSNIRPAVESLARIYQMDYQIAVNRFRLGKLHKFRSDIMHEGKLFPIHSLLISYLEAIYMDILMEILNLPCERRAEKVLNHPLFDLEKFIYQG